MARNSDSNNLIQQGYAGRMPLYALAGNKKSYMVAGGGGGMSRTGIPNGLVIFKCGQEKLEQIGNHNTNTDAVMCLDVHPSENVVIYIEQDKFARLHFSNGGTVLKTYFPTTEGAGEEREGGDGEKEGANNSNNTKSKNSNTNSNNNNKTINSDDLAKSTKVLRFSPTADKVAVGSFEGALSIVSYPNFAQLSRAATAHTADIDDISWNARGDILATASKDKTCKVWRVGNNTTTSSSLQTVHTLTFDAEGQKLIPRGCKFHPTQPNVLYTSAFILGKSTYIFVWNAETGAMIKKKKIHNTHTTSFAISPKGTYVGVGDVDGTIVVALTDGLRKVFQAKPHGFIITGLAFAPAKPTAESDSEVVISAGADYACKFTPIVHQSFVNYRLIVVVVSLLILIIAIFLRQFVLF